MTVVCPVCSTRVSASLPSISDHQRISCRRCGESLTVTGMLAPLDDELLMGWLGGASRRDEPYDDEVTPDDARLLDSPAASESSGSGNLVKER